MNKVLIKMDDYQEHVDGPGSWNDLNNNLRLCFCAQAYYFIIVFIYLYACTV